MPILDPAIQFSFSDTMSMQNTNYGKRFFLWYLKIASKNICRNSQTIEAAEQFKIDMRKSISYLNKKFDCHLKEKDFEDKIIFNYYQFLLDNIDHNIKEQYMKKVKGEYRIFSNNMKFFVPFVDYSSSHCWHLTDNPIAILGICTTDLHNDNIIHLINLEIDLMQASGFTLVLCVRIPEEGFAISNKIIENIIRTHYFAEIHFVFDFEDDMEMDNFEEVAKNILNAYDDIKGYFYLYSPFFEQISPSAKKYLKELKKKPRFTNTSLSKEFHFSLDSPIPDIIGSKPFPYCKTGFDCDRIRVMLCNVPFYDNDDDNTNLIPSGMTDLGIAYISPSDFMTWKQRRVPALIDLKSKGHHHIEKYLDFDDIHEIKSDFYVNETIFLANSDNETLEAVTTILGKVKSEFDEKKDKKFEKKNIFSLFNKKDIQKGLIYVGYAYKHYVHNGDIIKNFDFHANQMFTAFDACKVCLSKEPDSENKGIIYQVETGEGKSCIIHVIAAVLALMSKTVHIASSNIKLTNRDYYDSYSFFKKLGLTSAVLLHYNELPYISIDGSKIKDSKYERKYYPDEFFNKELFNNSSNMNYFVCGINNANQVVKSGVNIVFSTFINFESLYLKMMELYPSYIPKYFSKCNLLIDEADAILIDELQNGTILSCPMKSNGSEVLEYVYQNYSENKPAEEFVEEIQNQWPECCDICTEDILEMYQEIKLINSDEFQDGKKYLVDTIKNKKNIIIKAKEKIEKAKTKVKNASKNAINKITKKNLPIEEIKDEKPLKQILPFDYDHKGIVEPNKEFSGFVQQFIAIKEKLSKEDNENMIVKDLAMNYLYVSHPIFVNLYDRVCGFTGTLGNKYDKKILKEQYKLLTKKIPRNKPNKRIEFPVLICKDIIERNVKIVEEIVSFHKKEIPILVIFHDLNEIADVLKMLIEQGLKNINIFDGKDDKVRPDKIAGLKGAISLGTNVCGRGTDIKRPAFSLHVIVTYFTSNTRVMLQAFGRTARQGAEGTVRVICTKEQYISPIEIYNNNELNKSLSDFNLRNQLQLQFIDKYRTKREWIFSSRIKSQKISSDIIEKMRKIRINVNRIKAYHFNFPICMSYKTFLDIQAQKIFSLFNCPNCKYTWMLFQKYIREMILESWSLFISQAERKYNNNESIKSFNQYLLLEITNLENELDNYLPDSKCDIIPTFIHIFMKVAGKYQKDIIQSIPKKYSFYYDKPKRNRFCTFTIGFKPYSLVGESGSRINSLSNPEEELEYIKDPELQYMRQQPKGFSPLSITEKIDGVFNLICKKINEVIGSYIGLKFFLRRTLGGCEFGVCLDFISDGANKDIGPNCLVDKNPLLVFTISVKSMVPILAGILIIGLVYIASVSTTIADWVTNFPVKLTKEVIIKTVKVVAEYLVTNALENKLNKFCDGICDFLKKILSKNIEKIEKYNPKIADVFNMLSTLVASRDILLADKIGEIFENKTHISLSLNIGNMFQPNLPVNQFIKIGFLIMLCFASFMMGFNLHHSSLKYNTSKVALSYDKKQNPEREYEKKKDLVSIEKMEPYIEEMNQ